MAAGDKRFVSASGSNTSPYDTWAKAATAFSTAVAGSVAGEVFVIDAAFTTLEAGINVTLPGTPASPNVIVSATPGSGSSYTPAVGAYIASSTSTMTINGTYYAYGIDFRGTATGSHAITLHAANGDCGYHVDCKYQHTAGGTSSTFAFGSTNAAGGSHTILENPQFKTGNGGQFISYTGRLEIRGGSWISGGTLPNTVFKPSTSTRGSILLVDGFDGTNFATTTILSSGQGGAITRFRGIKMPSGWGVTTGFPIASASKQPGHLIELIDFMIGTTKWRYWAEHYSARIQSEGTVKVTANSHSIKVATGTAAGYPVAGAQVGEYYARLTGGVAKTLVLEMLTDNVTLKKTEVIFDVDYFNTSGSFLYSRGATAMLDVTSGGLLGAGGAAWDTSSETWSTSGISTPVKQYASLAVTPTEDGYCIVRPKLMKASATVYFDNALKVQ